MIDTGPGLIGQGVIGLPWGMPPGFIDAILASVSDATPTPLPRTPYLTPTPTATVLPPRAVVFGQAAGRIDWDGPDGGVWSGDFEHCSNYQLIADFGMPGRFWAVVILQPPPANLHWTGYSRRFSRNGRNPRSSSSRVSSAFSL